MNDTTNTVPSAEAQTLNEASSLQSEASASQQTTPETIPYARFKEVNDKFRATEQQFNSLKGELDAQSRLNQELNAALMLLQQGMAQPAQNTHDVQIDPLEYWQTAEQDPMTWEQTLSQRIMGNIMDHFNKQQKVESTVKSAIDQSLQKYPDLNNEKGKYFLENYARLLDEQLPPHVPVAQVFEMAAQEIHQFISGFKSQGIQESQSRTAEKLQAFTEGSGNMIPPEDPYQSALTKAKKTGNVEDLIRVKVQRMNANGV